jgi:hypothetical protein
MQVVLLVVDLLIIIGKGLVVIVVLLLHLEVNQVIMLTVVKFQAVKKRKKERSFKLMSDGVLYGLGVDLNSNLSFVDGDITLASYQDNLVQAVKNRLNTELDELDWFYYDYGSILTGFLGWKANDTTLGFIKSEISNVLQEEPRLVNYDIRLEYTGNGGVRIDLDLYPTSDLIIPANLVLTNTGVIELETSEDFNEEEE